MSQIERLGGRSINLGRSASSPDTELLLVLYIVGCRVDVFEGAAELLKQFIQHLDS